MQDLLDLLSETYLIKLTGTDVHRKRPMRTLRLPIPLRKLLTSDDYKLMEEAAEAGNLQEVLRYAHNLKGVCATLGLTGLQAQFADIVSLLRSGDYTLPQLQAKLAAVKNDWQRTLQYIEQLESA